MTGTSITRNAIEDAFDYACTSMGFTWGITVAAGSETYSAFDETHHVIAAVQAYSTQLIISHKPYVEELEFVRLFYDRLTGEDKK